MFITRLSAALHQSKVPYAIVGGHAVALHGALRGTLDIDFVIRWQRKHLRNAVKALSQLGLVSRLPISVDDVFNFRDEYINNRNMIAWSFYNPEKLDEQVDLLINFDLGRKSVLCATTTDGDILYINKADLIKMKTQSNRPQDIADIKALEQLPWKLFNILAPNNSSAAKSLAQRRECDFLKITENSTLHDHLAIPKQAKVN